MVFENNATVFNFKKFIFAQIVNLGTDPHYLDCRVFDFRRWENLRRVVAFL